MFTGLYQSGLILAVIITYYLLDFWLISRYDRQRRAEGSGRSWDYTLDPHSRLCDDFAAYHSALSESPS